MFSRWQGLLKRIYDNSLAQYQFPILIYPFNLWPIHPTITAVDETREIEPAETPTARPAERLPPHFILRRLHSISGIMPLGIYVVWHLIIGASAMSGRQAYDSLYAFINRIPLLLPLEILFIILPLGFHAIYGITIALRNRSNSFTYPNTDNLRYTLQRLTGYYLAFFIIVHMYFFWGHIHFTSVGRGAFTSSPYDFVQTHLKDPSLMVIYTLGVTAAAFHLANGLLIFCMTWGIAVNNRARRIAGWITALFFLLLMFIGIGAVQAFYAGHPVWPYPHG